MKKALVIILSVFISISMFANNARLHHVPADHIGIFHVNYKKISRSVNTQEFERIVLKNFKILLDKYRYAQVLKVFKEILPGLKEAGFDIYNDIYDFVFSASIRGNTDMVVGVRGNFEKSIFSKFMNETAVAKSRIIQGRKIFIKGTGKETSYFHRYSKNLIIICPSLSAMFKSLKALRTGRNILSNRKFASLYRRSIKNKALNIILTLDKLAQVFSSSMRAGAGRRRGSNPMAALFAGLVSNIDAVSINIDGPSRVSLNLKVYCKNPNVAAQIGMMAQQQLPNLPATLNQVIFKSNRKIAYLQRAIRKGKKYLQGRLLLEKHKKFFLLLFSYAGRRIRVRTINTQVVINFYWPRSIINSSIRRAGLDYNLNRLLR